MEIEDALLCFRRQKSSAASRGIEWKLTFQEWLMWWGDDLEQRGVGTSRLQMQRLADSGPYALGNIKKGYPLENAKTAGVCKRNRNGALAAETHQRRLNGLPMGESPDIEKRGMGEDEWELHKMFSAKVVCPFL